MRQTGNELILSGGVRPKLHGGRKRDFTVAMAERFAAVLAETCNVTLAAQAIGRSISNVYRHRERDATFRGHWDAALRMGYSRLEMMMLERALHGVEKRIKTRDGSETVMREYPDRVALTLLRMHRESVQGSDDQALDSQEVEEACARIEARLERLRHRDEAGPAGEVETKAARWSRIALIGWGLARRGSGSPRP